MDFFHSLMQIGSYALAFYALYLVVVSAAFGYYLWRRVFQHSDNGKGKGKGPLLPRRSFDSDHLR